MRDREVNLALAQQQSIKRLGTPEEIAALVLFFLSEQSRFMTDTGLTLDGGRRL